MKTIIQTVQNKLKASVFIRNNRDEGSRSMKIGIIKAQYLVLLIALFSASYVGAVTITSTATGGSWATATTWTCNCVPASNDDVVIVANATVTTGVAQTCAGIVITGTLSMASGDVLTVNGNVSGSGTWLNGTNNPRTISLSGNWSFNGTSTGNGATVVFTGSGTQTLSDKITSGTGIITINKASGTVTLGSAITIGTFTLTAGTFDASTYLFTATTVTLTAGTLRVGAATLATNYSFTPTPAAGFTIEYYNTTPTINGGAAITYQNLAFSGSGTATASASLIIQGNLTNTGGGSLDFGSNNVTLSGTVATNNVAGFTTTGTVTMSKTAGTATFTGNVNGVALTINGTGGTLNLGSGLTHTFTGVVTLTAGSLNGGSSTLNENATSTTAWNGTGSVFTAGTGTVNFGGAAQTLSATGTTTFNNLAFSGSGIKTLGSISIGSGGAFTTNNLAIVFNGNFINSGTFTAGSSPISINGTATQSIAGFTTTADVSMTKTGGTATFTGNVNGAGLTINGSGGTLNLGSGLTHTFTGIVTLTAGILNGGSSTLNENATSTNAWNGTGSVFTAGTSTVNFSGASQTLSSTATTFNNLTFSGSGTKTFAANLTINANLIVASGVTLTVPGFNFTVSGTTIVGDSISGSLDFSSATGTKTFTGNVTINQGGTWNETAAITVDFAGNLQNDGVFTASTGVHSFKGTTKTISGTAAISIPTTTFTGAYTNSGTLTVATALTIGPVTVVTLSNSGTITATTALSGKGGLTNSTGGVLNIGGSSGITTLTANAAGNTVNYTGTGQTVKLIAYNNLTLSGGSITFTQFSSITGNLTLSGAATATTVADLTIGGNLNIGDGTTFTVGGFNLTVTGNTSVGGGISGNLTISSTAGTKTFTGNVTINSGATWTESVGEAITFRGNLQNDGSFTATGAYTFGGASKTIGGTSAIFIPTATFTGAYTNNGTLTVATVLTVTGVTLTNNGTITATTALSGTGGTLLQGSTGVLNIGGTSGIAFLTATAAGNTVNYTGAVQTIKAVNYDDLVLSGSGIKSLTTQLITISGNLSIASNVKMNLGTATSRAHSLTLAGVIQIVGTYNSTNTSTFFDVATGDLVVAQSFKSWLGTTSTDWNVPTNWEGTSIPTSGNSVVISSGGNQPIITASAVCDDIIINAGATLSITGSNTFSISGNFHNNGVFTPGSSTVIFNGTAQTIETASLYNLELSGSTSLSMNSALAITGNLSIGNGATFNATGFALTVTGSTTVGGGTSGILTISSATGTKAFTGDVSIGSGATWNETAGAAVTFGGNLTNNGILNASTGIHTFSGATKTIDGTTAISIPSATFTGAYTNNATFTVATALTVTGAAVRLTNNDTIIASTALSGSGGLTQGATGVLNIGGTSGIAFLAASAVGNIVNYSGSVQNGAIPTIYHHLTLSGSGLKTFITTPTVNGILSLEGTASVVATSGRVTYGANATLKYNKPAAYTATTEEWLATFAATGGVVIANTGIISTGAAKSLNANVPLTINSGASLTTGATNTWTLSVGGTTTVSGTLTLSNTGTKTFTGNVTINSGGVWNETGIAAIGLAGNLQNDGTFTSNTGIHTFSGTTKTLSGTSSISIPNATFTGTYTNSGTFSVATLLTVTGVTLTNNGTITATTALSGTGGLTQGTTGILNLAGTSGITTLTATAVGNIVNYTGGAQTAKVTTYDNLTLSGSLSKTFATTPTVNGILSLEGTATVVVTTGVVTYGTGATLQYKGSGAQTTSDEEFLTSWAGSGGIKIENASGVTLNSAKNIGAHSFTIGSTVANSIFNDGGFQLTGTGTLNLTSGKFILGAATATTFPAFGTNNIAAGTTVEYAATTTQNIKGITYSNLTISGTGSKTANGNITVNGILNLSSANASSTQGCLEMTISYGSYPGSTNTDYLSSYVLTMGPDATTTGIGDVTGTVKRTTIVANTPYTFGNQYTTVALTSGTMPSDLSVTITIGTAPAGKTDAIKRTYEIVPTGGSGSTVTANFHYLDSELNGNTEANMVTWDYDIPNTWAPLPDEHGRANYDFTNNYLGLSNIPIAYFINTTGHAWRTIFTIANYAVGYYTWNGSTSNVWGTSDNWTPKGSPADVSHVIIPNASTTANDPVLPTGTTTINAIHIENGGVLTMGSSTLTIKNSLSGGWEDQNANGNDPGTSTVIFTMPGTIISGNARFYNVEIATGADITNQTASTMKIANTISRTGTGKWYADVYGATVEYNGASQTVLVPDGSPHYHNLILSGSGTKTLPGSALSLHGNLTISGTANVTAAAAITCLGNFSIASGSSFTTGAYSHSVGGNFLNSGTFVATTGSTISFNGSSADTIGGGSPSTFYNLTINNSSGVLLLDNATVNNTLTISSGNLIVGAKTLAIKGTVSKTSGCFVDASASSGTVEYSGGSAQSIASGTFLNDEVFNLKINNSNNVTFNGSLRLLNNLIITSGKLDAVTNSPTLVYAGTSAQTIGSGLFLNDVIKNLTIDNAAGVTLSNSTITTISGSLTINSGKQFIIDPTSKLTVDANGTIINNAAESGLVIESNASGSGSLIESTSGVVATVQRYIPTGSDYHFVSSPMADGISGIFRYAWLYSWNETTQYWDNIVSTQHALTPMKGFSVRLSNGTVPGTPNNPVLFAGNLNTGTQSINLSFTNAGGTEGFNLVGNPYPSYIDWDASGWTKNNLDDAIYFWDGTQYTYYVNKSGTLGGSRYIAPGQGFFVHVATAGTGSLGVSNTVKTHTAVVFRSVADNQLRLKIENDSMNDELIVRFSPDATTNFDRSLDAYKMFGNIKYPQLYTNTDDGKFASINSMPESNLDSTKVIMSLRIGVSGNYKITASDIETFKSGAYIALEDTKTHTTQILSENPVYSFYADTSNQTGRFIVWFYNKTNSVSEFSNREPSIISKGNTLFVDLNGMGNTGELMVSNMLGQTVYESHIKSNMQTSFVTNLPEGVYVVRVLVGGKWFDKKMMW